MSSKGALIKQAREKMDLSMEALADICLLDLPQLEDFEEGRAELSESALRFICNVLDISPKALEEGNIQKRVAPESLAELAEELEKVSMQLREESTWMQMSQPSMDVEPSIDMTAPKM